MMKLGNNSAGTGENKQADGTLGRRVRTAILSLVVTIGLAAGLVSGFDGSVTGAAMAAGGDRASASTGYTPLPSRQVADSGTCTFNCQSSYSNCTAGCRDYSCRSRCSGRYRACLTRCTTR